MVRPPARRVAVVSRPGQPPTALVTRAVAVDDDVSHHLLDADLDALHLGLTLDGPFDLVVDDAARGGAPARFVLLLFHLVPGGRLVSRLPDAGGPHERSRARLLALLADVERLRAAGPEPTVLVRSDPRPAAVRDRHNLAASLSTLDVDLAEQVVEAVQAVATLPTVPEADVDAVLGRAPLLQVPPASWAPSGRLRSNDPRVVARTTYDAPALTLREVTDAVVAPRQVVVWGAAAARGAMVLPASFRDPTRARLRIRSLVDWAPRTVLAPDVGDPPRLAGAWFHLDNVLRGHFGHAMTEQLSLVWGWREARRRHPGLRALVFDRPDHPVAGWERDLLAAAGIAPADVVALDAPVRVETLVSATPGYAIGAYVHPRLLEVWRETGERLETGADADAGPLPRRVFLTRPPGKRACLDADVVEATFARHGFETVRPETVPLARQVALVRSADVVAGYAGSALFHLALAERPRPVVVVSSTTYPALNEQQICAVHGHDLTLVRGPSVETGGGDGGFSLAAFHSHYRLDAAALAFLEATLAAL